MQQLPVYPVHLTLEQVAEITRRNPSTLRAYITSSDPTRRKRVPPGAFKSPGGRRWLWRAHDVYAWLSTGRTAHHGSINPEKTKGGAV